VSSSTTWRPRQHHGANGHVISAHDDEDILDLVAAVARGRGLAERAARDRRRGRDDVVNRVK
jgi:hypothetical protein